MSIVAILWRKAAILPDPQPPQKQAGGQFLSKTISSRLKYKKQLFPDRRPSETNEQS
jgi:hypothetical protein